jgi:hypothetical protein
MTASQILNLVEQATMADNSIGQFLATALKTVQNDALKIVLPIIQGGLTNIIANPSPANIVAQKGLILAQFMAALPNLEAAVAKDLATQIQADIAALALPAAA